MKKTLLLISAMALSLITNAQILDSENFNTLTLGNTHTDLDLTFTGGAGAGGYFRSVSNGDATASPPQTTNNAANSNVQIVANGFNGTQGMQITNPNGTGGFRQILKNGYQTSNWASRTSGNDVLDVSVTFFTGPATSSVTTNRFVISGDDPADMSTGNSIVAMDYDFNTREITGLGRLNNNGSRGFFFFQLGPNDAMGNPTALTAPINTWVTLTMSYNSTTGEYLWATDLNGGTLSGFSNSAFMITGQLPVTNQIFGFSGDTNTAVSSVIIDNYNVSAVAMSTLSVEENVIVENDIKIFPNPATDIINVSSAVLEIKNLKLVDLNGRVVLDKSIQNGNNTLDISTISNGIYLLNITAGDQVTTKRVIID